MKKVTFLLLVALALLTAGCKKDNKELPTVLKLSVNDECYEVPLTTGDAFDLTTLSTEFDARISVTNAGDFDRVAIAGQVGGSCTYHLDSISADVQIPIEYTAGEKSGTILLNTLHSGIPQFAVSGNATSDGDFYLSFVFQRLIMKYDNAGHLLYYRFEPHQTASSIDVTGWWDFKKHTVNGETYYSYHAHDPAFADKVINGFNPGMRVIMDDRYRIVKTIHLQASEQINQGDPLDGHDFYMFDLDHYIVASYVDRDIDGRTVAATYLQEVQDGEVLFDWWSTDHPEMDTMMDATFAGAVGKDYVHFNSIQVLPDGNWLCSFRHISSVIKIDRAGGTGNLLWRIAGAELDEPYRFHGQHYARMEGNTLTLFDNGNGHTPLVSKALKLTVNPETGTVTDGVNLLSGSYYTQACGSLTFSGNNFIVGWGMPGEATECDRIVTEHDAAGNEIFGIRMKGNNIQQNTLCCSYRCVRQNR